MAIKAYRPTTPAQRQKTTQDFDQITTRKPLKSLVLSKKQQAGKNNSGRITVRHRGGHLQPGIDPRVDPRRRAHGNAPRPADRGRARRRAVRAFGGAWVYSAAHTAGGA